MSAKNTANIAQCRGVLRKSIFNHVCYGNFPAYIQIIPPCLIFKLPPMSYIEIIPPVWTTAFDACDWPHLAFTFRALTTRRLNILQFLVVVSKVSDFERTAHAQIRGSQPGVHLRLTIYGENIFRLFISKHLYMHQLVLL